jgi:hypothetical protein
MGSLVTSGGAVNNTLIDQPFDTIERVGVGRTVGSFGEIVHTTLIPQRAFPTSVISSTLILNYLSLPAITILPDPRATALSIDNPNVITITILVMGSTQMICSTEMTIALTNETTSTLDNLPFNMPVPGASLSIESAPIEGRGFFIQSIVTNVNSDHENFQIVPGSSQIIAPFLTFPRITNIWNQVSFGVVLRTNNRAINIQNNNDRICQLGVVYVPN